MHAAIGRDKMPNATSPGLTFNFPNQVSYANALQPKLQFDFTVFIIQHYRS